MVTTQDLFLIFFLAFLEGILSIDNALVLAMMAKPLPPAQQRKALTYGLLGAVLFRLGSLLLVRELMKWVWLKYVGGGYLVVLALHHLIRGHKVKENHGLKTGQHRGFWKTVLLIELMDIAFAVDSILAAVALTPKFWIVFVGGFLGVILVRFAAQIFIKLLHRFPGFEPTAYGMIFLIGAKLIIEGLHLPGVEFESPQDAGFLVFWGLMLLTILNAFRKPRRPRSQA